MMPKHLIWIRVKRFIALWIREVIKESFSLFTDKNAQLHYVGLLIVLFLYIPNWNVHKTEDWLNESIDSFTIFLISFPIFIVINMISSTFRVCKNEARLGSWYGNKFIYHEPQRLLTVLVDENDNEKPIAFKIRDAVDGSLVHYQIQTDRTDSRAVIELAWPNGVRPIKFGEPRNIQKASYRLPKERKMSLLTNVEHNSTATRINVFMTGWDVKDK